MRQCKHSTHDTHQVGECFYAMCCTCGMKTGLFKNRAIAKRTLRSTPGPELKKQPIATAKVPKSGKRVWSCNLYPETKVKLQDLSYRLGLNGTLSRVMVSIMSIPMDELEELIKEKSVLYPSQLEISQRRKNERYRRSE